MRKISILLFVFFILGVGITFAGVERLVKYTDETDKNVTDARDYAKRAFDAKTLGEAQFYIHKTIESTEDAQDSLKELQKEINKFNTEMP